mmetsp:Transcript_562/g.1527  ORF Transcript_562/g.1527 Transcript_562/m.1527 type:complete len:220 (-) Transcript_562:381-1040(-)
MSLVRVQVRLADYLNPEEVSFLTGVLGHRSDCTHSSSEVGVVLEEAKVILVHLNANSTVNLSVLRSRQSMKIQKDFDPVLSCVLKDAVKIHEILGGRGDTMKVLQSLSDLRSRVLTCNFRTLIPIIAYPIPVSTWDAKNLHSTALHLCEVGLADGHVQPMEHFLPCPWATKIPQRHAPGTLRDPLEEVEWVLHPIFRHKTITVIDPMPLRRLGDGWSHR